MAQESLLSWRMNGRGARGGRFHRPPTRGVCAGTIRPKGKYPAWFERALLSRSTDTVERAEGVQLSVVASTLKRAEGVQVPVILAVTLLIAVQQRKPRTTHSTSTANSRYSRDGP